MPCRCPWWAVSSNRKRTRRTTTLRRPATWPEVAYRNFQPVNALRQDLRAWELRRKQLNSWLQAPAPTLLDCTCRPNPLRGDSRSKPYMLTISPAVEARAIEKLRQEELEEARARPKLDAPRGGSLRRAGNYRS